MKRLSMAAVILCTAVCANPGYAFIDYLFGGSSNKGAIDNSAVGDMRAWWTGNPVYQFNPYYTGSNSNPAAQGQQSAAPQVPQPNVTFNPGQGAQPPMDQQQYAPSAPQQYNAPQQYAQPQGYQPPAAQPTYQAPPQGYAPQQQASPPQQAYQAPAPQGYGAPTGYQPPPQAYQAPPPPQQQQFYNGEGGMYGGAGFVPGQPAQ